MQNLNRKILKKSLVVILLLTIVSFSIWYHLPIKKTINARVCSLNGEITDININIKFLRFFLKPTLVKGTIVFNDVKYVNMLDMGITYAKDNNIFINIITNIKLKFRGLLEIYFVNSSLKELCLSDAIIFVNINGNYNMDKFSFIHFTTDDYSMGKFGGIEYFGPVITKEETYNLYRSFYPNINNSN